jgi:FkbM family methyltransferase
MSTLAGLIPHPSFSLPNGLTVFGLNHNDTLNVYRDIFEDDCYRLHGITIKDGDCILDIGANTGLFIVFLNKIGVNARVFAFEPAPATFEVLSQNVALHNKMPVQLFNVGMARTPGQAPFTYYPRFSNASTFYPDESPEGALAARLYIIDQIPTLGFPLRQLCVAAHALLPWSMQHFILERVRRYHLKKEIVTCQLWNVSEFIRQHNISHIDLLKLDAEQSEEEILAGVAEEDWPKIRQIVVEVHGGQEATDAMAQMLRQRGFRATIDCNPAMPTLALIYGVRPA